MTKKLWLITITVLVLISTVPVNAQYSFTFTSELKAKVGKMDSLNTFLGLMVNTGEDDTYTFLLDKLCPQTWAASLCIDEFCFDDSIDWPVSAGDSANVIPDIYPLGNPGDGLFTIRIRSLNNPTDEKFLLFYLTGGYTTLLVCGDPDNAYKEYYSDAMDAIAVTHNNWPRWFAPLSEEDISYYDRLIWYTGDAESTLTEDDFTLLSDFLDAGGDMFITGQAIASDLQEDDFLNDYLHASFDQVVLSRQVDGLVRDIISEGFEFQISGSGGANNQTTPSSILPATGSTQTLIYDDQTTAGIKYSNGIYQLVFFSFGFEAINDSQVRNDLFNNIWHFFDLTTSVDESVEITVPVRLRISGSYPNPFNANTTIEFINPFTQNMSVSIYNVNGSLIDEIYSGRMLKGVHKITWNAVEFPSGIYYCKAQGAKSTTIPLTLIK
ncbi:MAG: T9SS type A sorting domain-containing protein [candidate division Zixibacteria bacterium]|nr:T9SS type A sorting domain-containing protein [candidate division Zixibacteria bacterium]